MQKVQKVQTDKIKTKSARKLHQLMEKRSDFICGIIVAQEILQMLIVKIVHMMIEYRV